MKNIIITIIICAGVFIGGSVYASFRFNAPGAQTSIPQITSIEIPVTPTPEPLAKIYTPEIQIKNNLTVEERLDLLENRVKKLEIQK